MLEAVLFDFGDTLLSTRLVWERVLPANADSLVEALEPHLPGLEGERLKRDYLEVRAEGARRAVRQHLETPAEASLAAALARQGLDIPAGLLAHAVDAYFAPEEAEYSIFNGIPETLAKLAAMGLKLGVLSNATSGRLVRRALERRRLLHPFKVVVVSAEEGPCKPEPALFRLALERLGASASKAAMVGDRLPTDILGAQRAGLRAVLVDFHGDGPEPSPPDPIPAALVRHPEALVPLFKSWLR
jgi:putative hydrolase of the HAD superfamily